jgi:hypothetical protein
MYMPSDEAIENHKEFLKRRKKALRIGLKKLQKRDERKAAQEQEEIESRPYNSFNVGIIQKKDNSDPYDVEEIFL